MIKIFSFPTHCDGKHVPGVDYVRVLRPMQELAKHPNFKVTIFTGQKGLKWDKLAQDNDIFFLNYITNPGAFVQASFFFAKYGKKVVFDIDDLIWEIQEDNAAYSTYSPGSEGRAVVTDIVARGSDFVTCTNGYLRNGIANHTGKQHDRIEVLPNYIDLDLYKWRRKLKKKYEITIGYFGSSSHFNDLANDSFVVGMEKLMKNYPQVRFFTVGAFIQQLKKKFGARYTTGFGNHDIYKWIKMMPKVLKDVDIFVAPLVDITYCKAKSYIKFLEYSSTKIPGVYQNIRQYQSVVKDGENGYLAKTSNEWYKKLRNLVENEELRRKIGENALKTLEYHTFEKNLDKYVQFFEKVSKFDKKVF